MVPARDGVNLSTDVWFPIGVEGKLPAILVRTPYSKGGHAAVRFAYYGYAVVVQDVRGKYDSEGAYTIMTHDAEDGYDALSWIVRQEWSNGKVATYGCSYPGENQILLAKKQHPNHTTMILEAAGGAIGTANDSYRFMGLFEGGIALLDEAVEWFMEKGGAKYKDEHGKGRSATYEDLSILPVTSIIERCGGPRTDFEAMLTHRISDPWWERFDGIADDDSIHIPALHVNSWFDYGVAETLHMFNLFQLNATNRTARDNQFCIIYPTEHCCFGDASEHTTVGSLQLGDARLDNFGIYLKWCDYWLKGEHNGILEMPKVRYYIMGLNEWRPSERWPLEATESANFYLDRRPSSGTSRHDGDLSPRLPSASAIDTIRYDPSDPAPSYAWPGAVDDSLIHNRSDILSYSTAVLDDPVEITGPVSATLWVSSTAKDTDFTVKLLDESPAGETFCVVQGAQRARYRSGFDHHVWMHPDSVYGIQIDLHATSYVFDAGHHIRVDVSSSDFPRLTRNLNTGGDNYSDTVTAVAVNRVYLSRDCPSHVTLPVISGSR
jgi:putative CocE/NonD family hydrolase